MLTRMQTETLRRATIRSFHPDYGAREERRVYQNRRKHGGPGMGTELCRRPDGHSGESKRCRAGNAGRRDQASYETTALLCSAWPTDEVALHKRRACLGVRRIQRASTIPAAVLAISAR